MARRKTLPESLRAKYALAERLTTLRAELFGDRGGPELARRLGLPVRTWYNYESGVTVSAEVILRIIELTSVEPMWLLHGKGPKFRSASAERRDAAGPGMSVGSLLRTALEILEKGEASPQTMIVSRKGTDRGTADDPADVVLLAVDETAVRGPITKLAGPRYIAARGEWLDAERECRVIRVEGDTMVPILADGAYVAFSKTEDDLAVLDGKMVVAWVDARPVVRWFQFCGRYVVLRAENTAAVPAQIPIDLEAQGKDARFRRVLWINTPH
jgi:Peptidase S24-like